MPCGTLYAVYHVLRRQAHLEKIEEGEPILEVLAHGGVREKASRHADADKGIEAECGSTAWTVSQATGCVVGYSEVC